MSEPLYEMRDVSTDEESLLELEKIEKHFGAVIALAGVSVAVYSGNATVCSGTTAPASPPSSRPCPGSTSPPADRS